MFFLQKAKDVTLPERCITIIGEIEQNRIACHLVLDKIIEDPQSNSCPNLSYADFSGPVANCNPTGSPYAQSSGQPVSPVSSLLSNSVGVGNPSSCSSPLFENMQAMLRNCGFSEQATAEITVAMNTLASYGLLNIGLAGLQNLIGVGQASSVLQNLGGLGSTSSTMQSKTNSTLLGPGYGSSASFGPVGSPGNLCNQTMSSPSRNSEGQHYDSLSDYQENTALSSSPLNSSPCYTNNSFGLGPGSPVEAKTEKVSKKVLVITILGKYLTGNFNRS